MALKSYLKAALTVSLFLIVFSLSTTAHAKTIYVDDDATGVNNGSSWADAYNYLQDALADANSSPKPVEIRVARGVYKPDQGAGITPGDREATFQLINGVTLKGGYAGFDEADPNSRDINLYETILSGDLDGNDVNVNDSADLLDEPTRSENSYHILTGKGTDSMAVIDGFTITGGNAQTWYGEDNIYGGGMFNGGWNGPYGSPTVLNCTFRGNSARYGGGIYTWKGSPIMTNCSLSDNSAEEGGGGMYCISGSSTTISGCVFSNNFAKSGGGMIVDGTPIITNCTFSQNYALLNGGGMHNSGDPKLTKCLFKENSAYSSGGFWGSGGAIYSRGGRPSLTECVFNRNWSRKCGAGIFSSGNEVILTNCSFSNNESRSWGAGLCNWKSNLIVTNCRFTGNTSGNRGSYSWRGGGGGIYNLEGSAIVTGCIFSGNVSVIEKGAGICNIESDSKFTNCTLSRNSASKGGGIYTMSGSLTLANCILWGNRDGSGTGETAQVTTDDATPLVNYCCIQDWTGSWGGLGNHGGDPLFIDPLGENYHLLVGSPCIDAGDNTAVPPSLVVDIAVNPRIVDDPETPDTGNPLPPLADAIVDMGAYEDPKKGSFILLSTRSVVVPEGRRATFTVALAEDPLDVVEVTVSRQSGDSDITVDSGALLIFDSSNYSQPQTVSLAAEEDSDHINGVAQIYISAPCFFTIAVTAAEMEIVFVDPDAPGSNDGSNWANAFNELHSALAVVFSDQQIWVAEGVYTPAEPFGDREASFGLINRVSIKGGYAGYGHQNPDDRDFNKYITVLSGDLNGDDGPDLNNNSENSFHVIDGNRTNSTAVLDGFTITGGNANGEGWYRLGGGMYCDCSAVVANCIFRNNCAYNGGAIHCGPTWCCVTDPTLINCSFERNAAQYGGAFSIGDSDPTIINCVITGNRAGKDGGGIIFDCDNFTIMKNCLISGNWAGGDGGGMFCIFTFSFHPANCTISDNSAGRYGGGMYCGYDTYATLDNFILWGNSDSSGSDAISQIYVERCQKPGIHYSCIQGGYPQWPDGDEVAHIYDSVIDEDPCFASPGYWGNFNDPNIIVEPNDSNAVWIDGDYHLLPDSPCIDTGDPNYIAEPNETDLDGNPRIIGGRIDMGAYEYNPPIPAEVDIEPDTLNLESKGRWITAFIQLPEDYNITDIDPNSIFLENEIKPDRFWLTEEGDVAVAKFGREEIQSILDIGDVELTITGRLTDGTLFEATDTIKVVGKGG